MRYYGFKVAYQPTVGSIVGISAKGCVKVGRATYVDRDGQEWMIEMQTADGPVYWKSRFDGGELIDVVPADWTQEQVQMRQVERSQEYEAAYQASSDADAHEAAAYQTGEDDTLAEAEEQSAAAYKEMTMASMRSDVAYAMVRLVGQEKARQPVA